MKFLESLHSRLQSPYPVPATDESLGTPVPPRPIPEAYALSLSSIAYAQLLLGDLPACKKSLDECESLLGDQDSVEPLVNAGYYGVAGDYFKVKADYGPYYKNALLYLACVDVDRELGEEDRRSRAHDLCIAALLGETIYNFGELVSTPTRIVITSSSDAAATSDSADSVWDRARLDQISHKRVQRGADRQIRESSEQLPLGSELSGIPSHLHLHPDLLLQPILESSLPFLRQKICLMALIQTAFARSRDGSSRLMTFQSIAEATRLPVHEVEHLIMKALRSVCVQKAISRPG